jgi:hypothetical protein
MMATKPVTEYTINFVWEKETKNTVRFTEKTEKGKPPLIGTLYVQKWAVGDAKTVSVVLSVQD